MIFPEARASNEQDGKARVFQLSVMRNPEVAADAEHSLDLNSRAGPDEVMKTIQRSLPGINSVVKAGLCRNEAENLQFSAEADLFFR